MKLHHLTIAQLRAMLSKKLVSRQEVFEYFKKRIHVLNPSLNAILTETKEIDTKEDSTLPLYGIPFSMKDTYVTKGIRTTAGSRVLKDYIPQYDATVYTKLKNHGAVLIGKTNCDAWGHGSSTENSDFGPVKNPWNHAYVAGGSSGGSAASVISGMSMFDIGEDTGGSIRLPSSFCSTVGLKVTYGLTSRYGCIAYASSLDTVGPIGKSVEDVAIILETIAGNDPLDATSVRHKTPKYIQTLRDKKNGLVIGLPKEYFKNSLTPSVAKKIQETIVVYKEMGIAFKEVSLSLTDYAIAAYYLLATSETSSNLARYDGIRYGNERSVFGKEAKLRMMLGAFTLSAGYYDAYYIKATKIRSLIKQEFDTVFKEVDLLLVPTSPTPAFKLGEKMNDPLQMYLSDIFTIPTNIAGIPALSVPCGLSEDTKLPIGFQLLGPAFSEGLILQTAYRYENAVGGFMKFDTPIE